MSHTNEITGIRHMCTISVWWSFLEMFSVNGTADFCWMSGDAKSSHCEICSYFAVIEKSILEILSSHVNITFVTSHCKVVHCNVFPFNQSWILNVEGNFFVINQKQIKFVLVVQQNSGILWINQIYNLFCTNFSGSI